MTVEANNYPKFLRPSICIQRDLEAKYHDRFPAGRKWKVNLRVTWLARIKGTRSGKLEQVKHCSVLENPIGVSGAVGQ